MSLLLSFFSFSYSSHPTCCEGISAQSMYMHITISVVFFSSSCGAYMEIKFILLMELSGSSMSKMFHGDIEEQQSWFRLPDSEGCVSGKTKSYQLTYISISM